MNLPNKLTFLRIFLAPVFFIVFYIPVWTGKFSEISVFVLLLLYICEEITDVLDGYFARKLNLISDVGKVLDPFADVLSRMTYFICFTGIGLMPVWIFIIIMYRELSATFLRLLMIRKGVAMAASIWGKLKAVAYAVSAIYGLMVVAFSRLNLFHDHTDVLASGAVVFFLLAAAASVGSFMTYVIPVIRSYKET